MDTYLGRGRGSPPLPAVRFLNTRDVASSLQHGAGGRLLTASWGIYPTFCIYSCSPGLDSAADISDGIHLHSRRLQPPPQPPPPPCFGSGQLLAPNSVATCMRGKRRKTCSSHELWKRSWPTRRWKRLTTPSCAKPARWLWVSSVLLASPVLDSDSLI